MTKVSPTTLLQPMTEITEAEIVTVMGEIDLHNTNSITRFGAAASEQATAVSRQMLSGVRNKDVGPVGEVMSDMILQIRGLDPTSLSGGGIFGWLKSKASRMAGFVQQFEEVSEQIEAMGENLRSHQVTLMTSVTMMDRLYEVTVDQFHRLEVYIMAGERVLSNLNNNAIPEMQKLVEANLPGSDGTPASLMPQAFSDLQNRRDQLDRKVHDLKLVRMVALQSLPKIRITQDTDNSLISKIDTIIATTIPLWYSEMAMALEINKTMQAAKVTSDVTDATDEMLRRGADQFQKATLSARKMVERSVVGVDAVKHINDVMISTLDDVVKITQDGRKARSDAEKSLIGMESALRDALKQTAEIKQDAPKSRVGFNSTGGSRNQASRRQDDPVRRDDPAIPDMMTQMMMANIIFSGDESSQSRDPEPATIHHSVPSSSNDHSYGGSSDSSPSYSSSDSGGSSYSGSGD
jgi:uncharacterized protein YaaN involved in tellurite resistance